MAKITTMTRELFKTKSDPHRKKILEIDANEKSSLSAIRSLPPNEAARKRLTLSDDLLFAVSIYLAINDLSVEILDTKNNDALNDARKTIYKAIICLEDVVSNLIDTPFSDLDEKLATIEGVPVKTRYALIRKIGLSIKLLMNAYGDNTKWKMSFVELQGRFATVSKNLIDMKKAAKDFFDPNSPEYDDTVLYVRLTKRLLGQSAEQYRDKYELSTRRIDDMRLAISYLAAQRRVCIAINEKDEAEEIKKKAIVWKDRLDKDQKKGTAK